jgi:membrane-associated phospholipid phosphatase
VDARQVVNGAAAPVPRTKRIQYGWVLEIAGCAVAFVAYDWMRERLAGSSADAFSNAQDIVRAEQWLGLYQEHAIQQAFLSADWFMSFWNIYYGTIHFVIPVVALVLLYRKMPARYLRWRNTLAFMLAFALLGFWLYPLMPPRLMPARYDFVDTAAQFFNFGPQVRVRLGPDGQPTAAALRAYGNLYAAMPSLHVGWSTWCAFALWPLARKTWVKVLLALYPVTILFCIVVTGNHWILDAAGGWIVLAAGYAVAGLLAKRRRRVAIASPRP